LDSGRRRHGEIACFCFGVEIWRGGGTPCDEQTIDTTILYYVLDVVVGAPDNSRGSIVADPNNSD
jgi:hypothetical protein